MDRIARFDHLSFLGGGGRHALKDSHVDFAIDFSWH